MYVEGWLGDKWHLRCPIIIYNSLQTIVGLCLLEWVASPGVQYFGIFLVALGSNANIPAVLAWQSNNIRGGNVPFAVELFDYSSGWHVNVIFPCGEWKGPTGENTY
jgi:hypothetical protein